MTIFLKTSLAIMGLMATVATAGVYSAAASSGSEEQQPKMLQADAATVPSDAAASRVVRVVGPRFFPDNGNIKLHGAAGKQARKQ